MKAHVFVDESGRVIGTTPAPDRKSEGPNVFVNAVPKNASAKFKVYEIDLSGDVAFDDKAGNADDFHRRLERHIKSRADLKPLPERKD